MTNEQSWLKVSGSNSCLIFIQAQPGAKQSALIGRHGDRLKWRIKAPATEGRANKELIAAVADFLSISKSQIQLKSGDTHRTKTLVISDCDPDQIISSITSYLKTLSA